MSRPTQVPAHLSLAFRIRGSHPLCLYFPVNSAMLALSTFYRSFYPDPQVGLGSFPFARHYSGYHSYFLLLRVLRCFSSPGLASSCLFFQHAICTISYAGVPPFGYHRLSVCLPLIDAFRCLLRPSSPYCA